eukprot:TRINITY_DN5224_c0_g2_i1.p1 TRINITY_DN5224_c0_g2~~TRINITY_DN5224_c0_g2_i1.p1  ORF type:complete len:442 (+),score=72.16 TRINITY_DN5224_c0_g2_i1:31-1326(+)
MDAPKPVSGGCKRKICLGFRGYRRPASSPLIQKRSFLRLGPALLMIFVFCARHGEASGGSCSGAASSPSCSSSDKTEIVALGILGLGAVGSEFLNQLESRTDFFQSHGISLKVVATARSQRMRLGGHELEDSLQEATNLTRFGDFVRQFGASKSIIVDCTADDAPADHYASWLSEGIHVLTPNKRAGSGPMSRFSAISAAERKGRARFLYESTVGAGLPLLSTLRDLRHSGDEVHAVEGVLSGTLSFIFGQLEKGSSFSEAVLAASEQGFTEPDPRDDLSGTDVQRKAVILARDLGLDLELEDVPVESLVPEALRNWDPSKEERSEGLAKSLVRQLRPFDDAIAQRAKAAADRNEVLRYVGLVDVARKRAVVELKSVPRSNPLAALQHADNMATFSTRRFSPRPLVVQGPGAGAAVTAFGIFSDLLRILSL